LSKGLSSFAAMVYVDLSSSFFADPFNFAILNNSQQLGLQVQRDLANLIEE
jgi:hypothetical protein